VLELLLLLEARDQGQNVLLVFSYVHVRLLKTLNQQIARVFVCAQSLGQRVHIVFVRLEKVDRGPTHWQNQCDRHLVAFLAPQVVRFVIVAEIVAGQHTCFRVLSRLAVKDCASGDFRLVCVRVCVFGGVSRRQDLE